MTTRWSAKALIFFAVALVCRAEIVDRVAVTVDHRVITESQILDAIHMTAFLNGEPADTSAAGKRKAADRLVEQILLRREMDLMHYSAHASDDVASLIAQVKARFKSEADFQAALRRSQLSELQLKQHLMWQLTTLRFIDFRFRPGVQVSNADLRAYYRDQLVEWKKKDIQRIPTFQQARSEIEKTLAEERVNEALDRWLAEARTQTQIVYHDEVFR